MNRAIKFRAWSAGAFYSSSLHFWDARLMQMLEAKNGEVIYEQFTGLLDKNGKEIYEGDIIKWYTDSMWKFGKVYYGRRGWNISFERAEPTMDEKRERQVVFEVQSFWPFYDKRDTETAQLEVIGNIHQNPDLLTP